jgi:phosphatidylglycerophosphate synthase
MKVTAAAIAAVQDKRLVVDWFLLLKASPYFAVPLVRLGLSANAVTVLWGVLNIVGAGLVFLSMRGAYWLLSAVFLTFVVAEILDTSDGEIARFTGTSNPVGGKLLDGVAHKASEFALTTAYACGAYVSTGSILALPIGLALLAAEAMITYSYERRLLIIRVHLQSKEKISGDRPSGRVYAEGSRWSQLQWKSRLRAINGLVTYKFSYVAVALAALLPQALLWVLAALAVYKHVAWWRAVSQTLRLTEQTVEA